MSDTPPPLGNPQPQPEQPSSPTSPGTGKTSSGKKWGIGCGIGCLTLLILAVVLVVVGINVGKKAITDFVEKGVSDAPVELATTTIPEDEVQSALQRFDSFSAAMEANEGVDPLILDETDINALIQNHPDFEGISESMVVSIVDDKLTSEVSFDLDALELPESFLSDAIAGKYFHGEVTLSLGTIAGRPSMYLESISVGGNPLPAAFMSELSKENILAEMQSDPELRQFFERIEELKIEENTLIVTPARSQP
ncbi:MAG: hypothetical protein AAF491_06680 [Verrucomicrobiota bacterium]